MLLHRAAHVIPSPVPCRTRAARATAAKGPLRCSTRSFKLLNPGFIAFRSHRPELAEFPGCGRGARMGEIQPPEAATAKG